MTVIAWLLGLIFLAIVWPRFVRAIMGLLVFLICAAILWGLITWGLTSWGDQPFNKAAGLALLFVGFGIASLIWEMISGHWEAYKYNRDKEEEEGRSHD